LEFNDTTAKLDLTNNELITTAPLPSIQSELAAGQIFSSSTGGVLGWMALGGGQTEVRFTLPGDADLDGNIGVGDLGALATNYGVTSGATWSQGNFNSDGKVDISDLGALATNY